MPPDGATCIAILPEILLLVSSVSIKLVSSSARVTSVKSEQGIVVGNTRTRSAESELQTPCTHGSDKNEPRNNG